MTPKSKALGKMKESTPMSKEIRDKKARTGEISKQTKIKHLHGIY